MTPECKLCDAQAFHTADGRSIASSATVPDALVGGLLPCEDLSALEASALTTNDSSKGCVVVMNWADSLHLASITSDLVIRCDLHFSLFIQLAIGGQW
jgi:hypothetical protein